MPGLFEDIKSERGKMPGRTCGVELVMDELDPDDLEAFKDVLADRMISATVIGKRLRTAGYSIGDSAIQRHRREDCVCSR